MKIVLSQSGFCRSAWWLALIAALCWISPTTAQTLLHRYNFAVDATDSVGTADGVLWDASVNNQALVLSGVKPSYMDLPNDLLVNLTNATFETWLTWNGGPAWQRIWDFGNSVQGEDVQGQADVALWLTPLDGAGGLGLHFKPSGVARYLVARGPALTPGFQQQVVFTFDKAASTAVLYVNGVQTAITTNFNSAPADMGPTFNNWIGHSQFMNDPDFAGTINDFRIYDGALDAAAVASNYQAGPDMGGWGSLQSLELRTESEIVAGNSQQIRAAASYANVSNLEVTFNPQITYAVSDPDVLSISPSGVLTAALTNATASVSASFGGLSVTNEITVVAPELLHRYSFNTDANDQVGIAHAQLVEATIANNAAVLSGTAPSYIDLPNDLFVTLTNATFEAWVTWNGGNNWQRIWDFGNTISGEDVQGSGQLGSIWLTPADVNLQTASYFEPEGADKLAIVTAPRLTPGYLHHVVWTHNKASTTTRLYVDGVQVAENLTASSSPADLGPTFNNWLGHSQYFQDPDFNGSFDEFRIYEGALSPAHVAINYANGPEGTRGALQALRIAAQPTMVIGNSQQVQVAADFANVKNLEITFDPVMTYSVSLPGSLALSGQGMIEAVGTSGAFVDVVASYMGQSVTQQVHVVLPAPPAATLLNRYSFNSDANDSVGGLHGALVGNATLSGGAVVMNGVKPSYVNLPNEVGNNLTNYSIEVWATVATTNNWQRIFDFGNNNVAEDVQGTGQRTLFLTPHSPLAGFRGPGAWMYTAPGVANRTNLAIGQPITMGTPYHIVLTYAKLGTIATMYIDGVPVSTNRNVLLSLADLGPRTNNWLGRSQWSGDPDLNGSIDEFRIYNGVLSPSRVLENYSAGPDTIVVPKPSLSIARSNGQITISWPAEFSGYVLESKTSLNTGTWASLGSGTLDGDRYKVTVTPGTGPGFYRLKK